MEFRILGPLEVVDAAGRMLGIRRSRDRAVLTALCADAGEVIPTDRIMELVWGDDQPDHPANALQVRISGLRRVLGAGRIQTTASGYALVIERDELDAWVFEDLIAEAGGCASGDPATAEARCSEALGRWRGTPLAELDDTSLLPLRTRLAELRRSAVALRASCLIDLGRPAEAVTVAAAGFDADPLDAGLARVAMTALHRAGRQAEALRLGQRHRLALADAGLEPGPEIAATEREVLTPLGAHSALGRRPPPFYGDRLFGRDRELAAAEHALAGQRLTTLVGPGGVGKTRLAREVALRHPGWWCDLSVIAAPAEIYAALCSQLGVHPEQGAAADSALIAALQPESGLLVLDNCDDLAAPAALLASALLSSCPEVDVLATSRQPLGLAGERAIELHPLPLGADAAASDLFVERARAVTELTDADRPAVAEIVARLDGLPLAIELAAGRMAVIGLDELLAHLDESVGHLSTAAAAQPERHRSLAAVVEGSWRYLDQPTQRLAVALAAFQGWFSVADAALATASDPAECAAAVDRLRRVSLLQTDGRRPSPRFRFLLPVREFVWGHAAEISDVDRLEAGHAAWVVETLHSARADLRGPGEAAAINTLTELRPELGLALARVDDQRRAALLAPLAELLALRLSAEDAAMFSDAVERRGVADPWVQAGAAQAAFLAGDLRGSDVLCAHCERAALASGTDVPWLVHWMHGSMPLFEGDPNSSRRRHEATLQAVSDPWELAFLGAARAFAAVHHGDADGLQLAAAAVDAARATGNPSCQAQALCALGAALHERDPAAALEAYEQALALATAVGNVVATGLARPRIAALRSQTSGTSVAQALEIELGVWQRVGNRAHAAELVALALPQLAARGDHRTVAVLVGAIGDAAGSRLQSPGERRRIDAAVAGARAALGPARFAEVSAEGAQLGVDAAVDIARAGLQRMVDAESGSR